MKEILPANHGLPAYEWDFERHTGPDRLRLRDHGNEVITGLVLLHAFETSLGRPRGESYRPVLTTMMDRLLASANDDGMFYNEIRCSDLTPIDKRISETMPSTSRSSPALDGRDGCASITPATVAR